ncbi:MAG: NYN domain-containing protein [Anaerolineales bacterium]|nr:NYN domain-containing protein [Anaerolineales bacterium]
MGQDAQVAVFIDYDNLEMSVEDALGKGADVDWAKVLQNASQFGRVVLRRAYADWAEASAKQRALMSLGVELVHVNSRRGKNAADIRIVIDIMELLHGEQNNFSHVLLVTGDRDFIDLVHRLRSYGKNVVGMGVTGTSSEFLVSACDKFIFYDKLPGVSKVKKNTQNQNPPAPKQQGSAPSRPLVAMATTPEGKLEQYSNLLASNKIRITPSVQRPLVIYKLYEIVKNHPEFSFNQLKEFAETYFETAAPKVESQLVLDVAHQLFHTFCFVFDSDTTERIWNRKMTLPESVRSAADLLDMCDGKILQILVNALGAADRLDKDVAALLLYGGVRSPKVIDHIADLIAVE